MIENFLEFKEKYEQLFTENNELESFSWSNFIPYDSEDLLSEIRLISINGVYYSSMNNDMKRVWIKIFKLLRSYSSSFFTLNFGNNVMITINRDKSIEVNEYEEYS
jgi:hypothetical protein